MRCAWQTKYRPDVGVMFNLATGCRGQKPDSRPLLKQAMPRLWAISLNGADDFDEKPGWGRYIQPLDKGSFEGANCSKPSRASGIKVRLGSSASGLAGMPTNTSPTRWLRGRN